MGNLNSAEQERTEKHLMTDSAAFEELLRIEAELIEDYLEGGLSNREKEKFDNFFLAAPERQQQLAFAQALKRYVKEHRLQAVTPSPWVKFRQAARLRRGPLVQWALVASLILIIAGGSWSVMQISKLRSALEQAGTAESQKRWIDLQNQNSKLASALQREQSRVKLLEQSSAGRKNNEALSASSLPGDQLQASLISVALAPGLLRDAEGMKRIHIPDKASVVQFDLIMEPQEYSRYQATVQRISGENLITQVAPGTQSGEGGKIFRLILPKQLLHPGDFVLKLSGIPATGEPADVGKYYFRIIP